MKMTSHQKKLITIKSSSILDIICIKNTYFVFLDNGMFYQLEIISDSSPQEDEEMFVTPSGEINIFQLSEQGQLQECDEIFAVCPVTDGFVVFATKADKFFLETYKLYETSPRYVISVQVPKGTSAVLLRCLSTNFTVSLKRYLFPDLELFDDEVVLVGLSSGIVAWFSTHNPNKGLKTLCHAVQPVKMFHLITDRLNGRHKGLLICLTNGIVTATVDTEDSIKSNTFFLTGEIIAAAGIGDKLVTSDGVDCSLNQPCLGDNPTVKSSIFPVKGVQCICTVDDSGSIVIVGTLHRTVYFINILVTPVGNPNSFVMPDQHILDGIMYCTQQMDEVNKEIDREDIIMQAISATSIANSLTNLFQINVLVYPGEKIKVSIRLVEDAFTFSSDLWKIHLKLSNSNDKQLLVKKLQNNLTRQSDLVVEMFCDVVVPTVLDCSLVAVIDNTLPWLIIHIGKVDVDACFLLEPVNLLQTGYSLLMDVDKAHTDDCQINIKLPDDFPINSFFNLLLKDVQNRISEECMKFLTDEKKRVLHMKISNFIAIFSLDEQKHLLVISCSDVDVCHQVKSAVEKRFCSKKSKIIDANLILEIQALHQILEIQRLKVLPNVEEITAIKRKMRRDISSSFLL